MVKKNNNVLKRAKKYKRIYLLVLIILAKAIFCISSCQAFMFYFIMIYLSKIKIEFLFIYFSFVKCNQYNLY